MEGSSENFGMQSGGNKWMLKTEQINDCLAFFSESIATYFLRF